ncbi:Arabinanase/levansucrase/invertase [Daedaleopsis nitida]|nr:Arabinanase/levansucrase/invertase [Daedaleopsis nitida]
MRRAFFLSAFYALSVSAASWIAPGAVWYDSAGAKIDAHGGMIIKPGDIYYWVGQSWDSNTSPRIYSSKDLINWDNRGLANSIEWLYRPKMFVSGGRYHIWGQVNRLTQGMSSTDIAGGYNLYGSPMSIPPDSYTFSDCGVFADTDGNDYWVTSADHNTIAINHINGGTTATVGDRIAYLSLGAYEAPAMFKVGSVYFLIVSSKTGYRPDPDKVFWATNLAGPWSGGTDIAPESTNTYNSQSTFVLTIAGSSQTTYMFMGDAWDSQGTSASNYMWLPLSVSTSAHTATLQDYAYWKVNPSTGVVTTSSTGKRYEAEDAAIAGRAAVTDCEKCLTKRSVHQIDSGSNVTFADIEGWGNGERQWMSLHYTVNNATATGGDAYVHINSEKYRVRDLNVRAGVHHTVPISVVLKKKNVVTFSIESDDNEFEAHLDGIEVLDGTEEEIEVQL